MVLRVVWITDLVSGFVGACSPRSTMDIPSDIDRRRVEFGVV